MNLTNIMLIEDNNADIDLIREAFSLLNLDVNLFIAKDGDEALGFFANKRNKIIYDLDLIILDLNIPGHNGFEILSEIRKNDKLNELPIIILTSSRYEEDVYLGYMFKANAVLFKTADFNEMLRMLKAVYKYWVENK